MLKRFCNQCNREIPGNDVFYILKIQKSEGHTIKNMSVTETVGEIDMCTDCFKSLIKKVEADKCQLIFLIMS